jgi:phosphatidylinositol alpha-1,6-mannosyltransferase
MILGLFPGLSTPGGVQRAGGLTAAVLASFAKERDEPYTFLSLNDPADKALLQIGSEKIAFTGFGRSKRTFLRAALRTAFKRPSLVVALHPNLAPVVAAVKMFAPRTRSIIFAHGVEVWAPLGPGRRWSLRRSDLVLAPSADTVRQLVTQQGVADEKVRKLPWSLGPEFDPSALPCARRLPDGFPRGPIILTVGRWDAREAYKGVDHLIMALPALLRTLPDLHLVAIGEGTDLPRLEGLGREECVSTHVHFLPQMQPEELSLAYGACELFALPSRGEGFGLVFLEAMSRGKAVIGGAHGGTPEIIEEGINGYLVPYGDVTQLTARLLRLLSDESCRRRMGQQAFERVCSNFTYPHFSAELTRLLDGVLAS